MEKKQLQQVYDMVDSIPFSRPKKNINRDFADCVMMAELIHHYSPKIISLHNYPAANSLSKKVDNWTTLNNKVLKKMGIVLSKQQMEDLANAAPYIIEQLLYQLVVRFEKPDEEGRLTQNVRNSQIRNESRKNKQNEKGWNHRGEQTQFKAIVSGQLSEDYVNKQAEQILELVAMIDRATADLALVVEKSKAKDEIIRNLQKKLEKIIYE